MHSPIAHWGLCGRRGNIYLHHGLCRMPHERRDIYLALQAYNWCNLSGKGVTAIPVQALSWKPFQEEPNFRLVRLGFYLPSSSWAGMFYRFLFTSYASFGYSLKVKIFHAQLPLSARSSLSLPAFTVWCFYSQRDIVNHRKPGSVYLDGTGCHPLWFWICSIGLHRHQIFHWK